MNKFDPMLLTIPQDDNQQSNIVIMPSLLQETMSMIFESYDYCALHEDYDPDYLPLSIQALISSEMSRVTMRLTSVMAWLMARKAVAGGQMCPQEAREKYRLEGAEHCLEHPEGINDILPHYMSDLLHRSQKLYTRIWTLDQQQEATQLSLQLA